MAVAACGTGMAERWATAQSEQEASDVPVGCVCITEAVEATRTSNRHRRATRVRTVLERSVRVRLDEVIGLGRALLAVLPQLANFYISVTSAAYQESFRIFHTVAIEFALCWKGLEYSWC